MSEQTINIGKHDQREKTRRRREIVIALLCFALIGLLTWVQLKYMGVNSYLFVGLLNLNFFLLLLVLFIVTRNAVKLLLERRRKVLGSKLRTRLVLAFISLSLIPTVLMFLVSVKFVQTSVEYWFKVQVEDSMEQALGLGEAFYRTAQDKLGARAAAMEQEIREKEFKWGGRGMDDFLAAKFKEHGLAILSVINPDGTFQNQHVAPAIEADWPEIKDRVERAVKTRSSSPIMLPTAENDLILVFRAVDGGETGHLVLGEAIGQGVHHRLRQVINGLNEYQKLKTLKNPWTMTLYMTLGVMTMLIILGAIWFGFRLAKELSAPVQALAAGTERVARGDLTVRLEDRSDDELGFLVQSFNRMTDDLRESRARLDTYNRRLSQQNRELQQRGRYIEALLNNITSGVISLDPDGRIGTVNRAAQEILGVESAFLVGRNVMDLLSGNLAEMMTEAVRQMRHDPVSQWQRQLDIAIGGHQRRLLVNVVSLVTDEGEVAGVVAVFEDITELEKMQRMAAWREVARRIAHEIKNPLTPIKLSAQRLKRRFGDKVEDKVFDECTQLIVTQVERIQQMVTQFSAYAKLPEVMPRQDHLPPLLKEIMAMFENTRPDITWELDCDDFMPAFPFDREGIRKVLINLLTNAAEALDGREDGRVSVVVEADEPRGMVTLTVADNGRGLSSEEQTRLFEPYFSKKKGGTGLGLTIVRSIIGDHRGRIHVHPNTGKGSIFQIELPID
jgi:two-component system nitrogen regulation sensor histidine kinase NtrY